MERFGLLPPVRIFLVRRGVASAKQASEEPCDDGPECAKREWGGGDGFCFRFRRFVLRLLLRGWFFSDFQLFFHACRKLAEHLPRYFLNHAATELDDLSDEVDV